MEKYLFTIYDRQILNKPEKKSKESLMIAGGFKTTVSLNIKEIAKLVIPPLSRPWSMATFNGKRHGDNWKSQRIIALDFDNKPREGEGVITVDQVIDRLKKFDINPNFYYSTLSDTPECPKFRMVFMLDKVLEDKEEMKYIWKGLKAFFPEADPVPMMLPSYFYPGKESKILTIDEVPYQNLRLCVDGALRVKDGGPRILTREIKRKKVYQKKKIVDVSEVKKLETEEKKIQEFLKFRKLNKFNPTIIASEIKIFEDFINGKWIYFPQLLGIFTSLHWFKGGVKYGKEIMTKYNELGKTNYEREKFDMLDNIALHRLLPKKLEDFSPHEEDKKSGFKDLTDFVRLKPGEIEILNVPEKTPLQEAENKLKEYFGALASNEISPELKGKINIIKLPTGIGKTEQLTNLKDVLIAAPTNALVGEIYGRMKTPSLKTEEVPNFSDDFINSRIKDQYTMGHYSGAKSIIKKIAKGELCGTAKDKELATSYLKSYKEIKSFEGPESLIMSHEMALIQTFSKEVVIFDEDPLPFLIPIKSFTINDWINLIHLIKTKFPDCSKELDLINKQIMKSEPGYTYQTPDLRWLMKKIFSLDSFRGIDVENDILSFFSSKHFIRDELNPATVFYILKRDFPPDATIFIQSATISLEIYRKLFGSRIGRVIDLSNVEHKGKISQCTEYSFSRESLMSNNLISKIKPYVQNCKVLTFKNTIGRFENSLKNIYFGNCLGYDGQKGKNLAIVGTNHLNPNKYFLTAKILGLNINFMDKKVSSRLVSRNGFEFYFPTFKDPHLSEIQISFIEAELIQAVGRARALREDVKVLVFSNLPLLLTTEFFKLNANPEAEDTERFKNLKGNQRTKNSRQLH